MPLSAEGFAKKTNVSRETLADYQAWQGLLEKWNARINLVAPSTLPDFWERHALDSWQICEFLAPKKVNNEPEMVNTGPHIVDFGSGAGFPGLAAAIHCKQSGAGRVTLIESAGKKASFLKTVIRDLKLPAEVRAERIENLSPLSADIITARAFAPLPRLLDYAAPHMSENTEFLLLKGENVDEELENVSATWTFTSNTVKSITDEAASILRLSHVRPRAT